LAQPI